METVLFQDETINPKYKAWAETYYFESWLIWIGMILLGKLLIVSFSKIH